MSESTGMQSAQGLEMAASEFRRNVQDASQRLSTAAEQFINMSEGLAEAVTNARRAAEQAQAAQAAVESIQAQMQGDYGAVSDLVRELQQRIGALAILAQPLGAASASTTAAAVLPVETPPAAPPPAPESQVEASPETVAAPASQTYRAYGAPAYGAREAATAVSSYASRQPVYSSSSRSW